MNVVTVHGNVSGGGIVTGQYFGAQQPADPSGT
jgi:hypothetical protein